MAAATVTRREQLQALLEQQLDAIDRDARDNGHRPETWTREWPTAHTRCTGCGRTAVVRVYPADQRVWHASGLTDPCAQPCR